MSLCPPDSAANAKKLEIMDTTLLVGQRNLKQYGWRPSYSFRSCSCSCTGFGPVTLISLSISLVLFRTLLEKILWFWLKWFFGLLSSRESNLLFCSWYCPLTNQQSLLSGFEVFLFRWKRRPRRWFKFRGDTHFHSVTYTIRRDFLRKWAQLRNWHFHPLFRHTCLNFVHIYRQEYSGEIESYKYQITFPSNFKWEKLIKKIKTKAKTHVTLWATYFPLNSVSYSKLRNFYLEERWFHLCRCALLEIQN